MKAPILSNGMFYNAHVEKGSVIVICNTAIEPIFFVMILASKSRRKWRKVCHSVCFQSSQPTFNIFSSNMYIFRLKRLNALSFPDFLETWILALNKLICWEPDWKSDLLSMKMPPAHYIWGMYPAYNWFNSKTSNLDCCIFKLLTIYFSLKAWKFLVYHFSTIFFEQKKSTHSFSRNTVDYFSNFNLKNHWKSAALSIEMCGFWA